MCIENGTLQDSNGCAGTRQIRVNGEAFLASDNFETRKTGFLFHVPGFHLTGTGEWCTLCGKRVRMRERQVDGR